MGFTPAVSRTDTPLFEALQEVADEVYGANVIPTVQVGSPIRTSFVTWVLPATAIPLLPLLRRICRRTRQRRAFGGVSNYSVE